jgi:hypothetical protein
MTVNENSPQKAFGQAGRAAGAIRDSMSEKIQRAPQREAKLMIFDAPSLTGRLIRMRASLTNPQAVPHIHTNLDDFGRIFYRHAALYPKKQNNILIFSPDDRKPLSLTLIALWDEAYLGDSLVVAASFQVRL